MKISKETENLGEGESVPPTGRKNRVWAKIVQTYTEMIGGKLLSKLLVLEEQDYYYPTGN